MIYKIATGVFAFLVLSASTSTAETVLSNGKGVVMVNSGVGYRAVSGATSLKAGDRVMLNSGSSASLRFADGCRVPLQAGQVYTVSKASPCKFRAQAGAAGAGLGLAAGAGSGFSAIIPVVAATVGTVASVTGAVVAANQASKADKKLSQISVP